MVPKMFQKCNKNQHGTGVTHFVQAGFQNLIKILSKSEGGVQEICCEWHGSTSFLMTMLSYRFDANVAKILKFNDSAIDFS